MRARKYYFRLMSTAAKNTLQLTGDGVRQWAYRALTFAVGIAAYVVMTGFDEAAAKWKEAIAFGFVGTTVVTLGFYAFYLGLAPYHVHDEDEKAANERREQDREDFDQRMQQAADQFKAAQEEAVRLREQDKAEADRKHAELLAKIGAISAERDELSGMASALQGQIDDRFNLPDVKEAIDELAREGGRLPNDAARVGEWLQRVREYTRRSLRNRYADEAEEAIARGIHANADLRPQQQRDECLNWLRGCARNLKDDWIARV